jgi:hypothetical protein
MNTATARRHAGIGRRYDLKKGERAPVTITTLRVAELRRLFQARYGHVLPDDDAGRDDAGCLLSRNLSQEARRRTQTGNVDCRLAGGAPLRDRSSKPDERVLRSVPNADNGLSKASMERCW